MLATACLALSEVSLVASYRIAVRDSIKVYTMLFSCFVTHALVPNFRSPPPPARRIFLTLIFHDVRVHVVSTDALPEDSRITGPMIVVHIVDSSTGRYITRTANPEVKLLFSVKRLIPSG